MVVWSSYGTAYTLDTFRSRGREMSDKFGEERESLAKPGRHCAAAVQVSYKVIKCAWRRSNEWWAKIANRTEGGLD